jgi:plasmid stabilization system protein ParE
MMVEWTEAAAGHVQAIRDYIARSSPGYAQAVADRIVRRTTALADHPLSGAEVPEYEDASIREVLEHPYRILYRAAADRVMILAVVHGARRLPRTPPG